jgi:hypothetical protein
MSSKVKGLTLMGGGMLSHPALGCLKVIDDVAVRGEGTGLTTLLLSPIRLSFVDWVTGGERQKGGNYLSLLGGFGSHKSSLSSLVLYVEYLEWVGPARCMESSLADPSSSADARVCS